MATTDGPIHIGVIGLGRTGWANHCKHLATLPERYVIAAVSDFDPSRRAEAEAAFGCTSYETPEQLLADARVEVVTVATPSHLHLPHTEAALAAGKHVVCEKPMAGSLADADRMIAAAKRADRVLTIFQNRRYAPDFLQVRRVIESGALGRIVHVRIAIHSYGRRWDWQTLREFHGGALNNTASHFIDSALLLMGDADPQVFAHMDRTLSSGDAEDFCKVVFRAPGHPLVEVEVSQAVATPQDVWLVMGTHGGLSGTPHQLRWRTSNVASLPPRPVERAPTPDRAYNSEPYEWQEHTWARPTDVPPEPVQFYTGLWEALRRGKPLPVTPQSVRRQIAVLDRCRASAAEGGWN